MRKLNEYGFVAVNLYFSAICNLECTYCFQPKISGHMGEVNKEIIEWITSGKMEDDIEKYIGLDTEILSLWGGEPTINLPYLEDRLDYIVDRFPKFHQVTFSTNLSKRVLVDNIIQFVKKLKSLEDKRHVELHLQISIDGTPNINDKNRIGSSSDEIVSNIDYLLEALNTYDLNSHINKPSIKGTQGTESLRILSNPDELFNHYKYFSDLYNRWDTINAAKAPDNGEIITLVCPGNFTSEDGKNFANIAKTTLSSDFRKAYDWHKRIRFSNQVIQRVHQFMDHLNDYSLNFFDRSLDFAKSFNCSAGKSCAGLTHNGEFHWCQSTYFFDKQAREYIKQQNLVTDFEKNQGFSFRNFENFVDDIEIAPYDNEFLLTRSIALMDTYNKSIPLKAHYLDVMIRELAAANQISAEYNDDIWRKLATSYFLFAGTDCPANNVWENGSIWVRSTSHMRLILNGAFEEICMSIKNNKKGAR